MQLNFPTVACLAGSLMLATGLHAAEVVIDDFSTAQSATSSVDGAGILGGERDATVLGGHVLNVSGGSAVMSKPAHEGAGGFIIFQWAGNDNDNIVAYELGDVDLTDGGSNNHISIEVSSVTGTVAGLFSVRESATEFAILDFNIDHAGTYHFAMDSLPFSTPPPDFSKINFINMRMIMDPGEAITITRFSATSGPVVFEDGFENP